MRPFALALLTALVLAICFPSLGYAHGDALVAFDFTGAEMGLIDVFDERGSAQLYFESNLGLVELAVYTAT